MTDRVRCSDCWKGLRVTAAGAVTEDHCSTCHGAGWVERAAEMTMKLLDQGAGDHSEEALRLAEMNAGRLRPGWCECEGDKLAEGRGAYFRAAGVHGWACCHCNRLLQVG
jgi:hypothetical protein